LKHYWLERNLEINPKMDRFPIRCGLHQSSPSQSRCRPAHSSIKAHASSAFRFTVSPSPPRFFSLAWSGKQHRLIEKGGGKIRREQLNKQKRFLKSATRSHSDSRPSIDRLVIGTYKPRATPSLFSHSSIAPPRSQQPVHTLC
jgi:hypothetical protein